MRASSLSALAQTNAPSWPSVQDRIWWREPWHMLLSVLLVGLSAAVVIVLARKLWPEDNRQPGARSVDLLTSRAIDLQDERSANGQIDREEYLQRRRNILGR